MANLIDEFTAYSGDMLRESAPVVEIELHYNRAYLLFNFPSAGSNGADIYMVSVKMFEYSSAGLKQEDFISSTITQFDPAQTVYAVNLPEIPEHHVYKDLNNSWYRFEITYMYKPGNSVDGGPIFYSRMFTKFIDNSEPVIYTNYISKYMRGDFRSHLLRNKNINVWFNTDMVEPQENDILSRGASFAFKNVYDIKYIDDNLEYTVKPITDYCMNAILRITSYRKFSSVIDTYFQDDVPDYGEISFKFMYNFDTYRVVFKGDIKALQKLI